MNIVNRIQFPRTSETSRLYMKCNEAAMLNFDAGKVEVSLSKNGILSFDSYFNSFYEKFYAKYTKLHSLYYLLKLEGYFQVSLYREFHKQENRELIHTQIFENCQALQPVKIVLPESWRSENAGRVYLEITCLSDSGSFIGGFIATDQPKVREVSLGVVTCTFKKEAYVKNTLDTIVKDDSLKEKSLAVFVVDNGQTLQRDEFKDSRIQLIPNRNLGGAGGFTRGLIQALQEEKHTHFLLMDDDIDLESESIYRLFSLYEYATQDFAVSGSMLDLYKKYTLYEAGGLYAKCFDSDGSHLYSPFSIVPLKNKLNLNNSASNNLLLSEDIPDYGAFWFFALSREIIHEIGLPMPFFIRADDIEFGLRITKCLGKQVVAFPSIAVWHEPFYTKNPIWVTYYQWRNTLVTHSIQNSLTYSVAIQFFTKSFLRKIFIFDYNSAEVMLKGFEDYMKGPSVIKSQDPERLHIDILALSKKYSSQNLSANTLLKIDSKPHLLSQNKSEFILKIKKTLGLLTLNGHLLPSFMLSNESVLYWIGSEREDWWTKIFPKKQVIISREGNNTIAHHKMSNLVGIGLLLRWFQIILRSAIQWSSVSSEWRKSHKYFTSIEFWKEYLKLNEQT
jgi:galactofuranosylgalactofuranosylrhamnosyl-N-acetylglucosaminyl-diphospho-decaprenol beta-1,5/1,6-galactofuranosyltransferase